MAFGIHSFTSKDNLVRKAFRLFCFLIHAYLIFYEPDKIFYYIIEYEWKLYPFLIIYIGTKKPKLTLQIPSVQMLDCSYEMFNTCEKNVLLNFYLPLGVSFVAHLFVLHLKHLSGLRVGEMLSRSQPRPNDFSLCQHPHRNSHNRYLDCPSNALVDWGLLKSN